MVFSDSTTLNLLSEYIRIIPVLSVHFLTSYNVILPSLKVTIAETMLAVLLVLLLTTPHIAISSLFCGDCRTVSINATGPAATHQHGSLGRWDLE